MKAINSALVLLLLSCNTAKKSGVITSAPIKHIGSTATIYVTSKDTDKRLTKSGALTFTDVEQPLETDICVFIDPSKTYQTIVGIGGALTDASAETFSRLPKNQQQQFLQSYYDSEVGIGYTLARTHINSCDFSSESYTYVNPNDSSLKSFDVAHDRQYRIPFIKQAIAAAGGSLTLYASPWSPPAWMKDNNNMLRGGKLLPAYNQSWANYYVQFIKSYEKEGIPIWGLTVQNETMATQKWESCLYTAAEERDFIKNYLGPTLHKAGMNERKLIAWDHNRDLIYHRASTILDDPMAAKYVWGIGYHWYETWTGSAMQFNNVNAVYDAYPNTNLMFTEGCVEKFDFKRIKDWALGEQYGFSMINDFNSGAAGWTDWNILLDHNGGPNHAGNFCFAPVIADTRTGQLHYTNSYYYIGHFSKFIKPGAQRLATVTSRSNLLATAFKNSNGQLVAVVMNNTNKAVPYHLIVGKKEATVVSEPHSIVTVVMG